MLQTARNDSNFITKEPVAFNLCYQSKWKLHYNPLLRDHCASSDRQLNCHTVQCILYIYITGHHHWHHSSTTEMAAGIILSICTNVQQQNILLPLRYAKLSQWQWWILQSSWICRRLVWYTGTNVSAELSTSIFKAVWQDSSSCRKRVR